MGKTLKLIDRSVRVCVSGSGSALMIKLFRTQKMSVCVCVLV